MYPLIPSMQALLLSAFMFWWIALGVHVFFEDIIAMLIKPAVK